MLLCLSVIYYFPFVLDWFSCGILDEKLQFLRTWSVVTKKKKKGLK